MRFLVWTGVALLVLAGLVVLVGWLLPATREGRAETVIAAPPARIVAVIADVAAQPGWRDGIAAVERTGDGWVEVTARGERISFVTEEMGETRIRLRFASDASADNRSQGRAPLLPQRLDHLTWLGLSRSSLESLQQALRQSGHRVTIAPSPSGVHAIMIKPGGLFGGADPRREGVALGD